MPNMVATDPAAAMAMRMNRICMVPLPIIKPPDWYPGAKIRLTHIVSFPIQTVLSALESHQVSPAMQESRAIPPVGNFTRPKDTLLFICQSYYIRSVEICKDAILYFYSFIFIYRFF